MKSEKQYAGHPVIKTPHTSFFKEDLALKSEARQFDSDLSDSSFRENRKLY